MVLIDKNKVVCQNHNQQINFCHYTASRQIVKEVIMRYLNEIQEDERVMEHYMCRQKQHLKTRAGKTYLSLKLQDKTKVVDAKVWEMHNEIEDFEVNEVIKIDGTALLYNNEIQIKINRIRKSEPGEYEIGDLIPRTEKDIDELYAQLMGFVDSVKNQYLHQLLKNILVKNETVANAITSHSAAKRMHHSYFGGLLEHTVSVAEICDFMSGRYKNVDRDLLITAAILHDIAKIYELEPMPSSGYTDDGQMLRHIYIGAELIYKECLEIPGFPPVLESLLKHAILAHHGEYEFGSPKLPMTVEAFILHAADNMDAKIKVYEEAVNVENIQGPWVGYHNLLARYLRTSQYE